MFDRNHDVTDAEFKMLKAAAWLTAAVLELERPVTQAIERPPPWRSSPAGGVGAIGSGSWL